MEQNRCYVVLGSNTNTHANIKLAQDRLIDFFGLLYFSTPTYTEPIGLENPAKFLNVVASFETVLDKDEVESVLKAIEHSGHRNPNSKENIAIDIDLIYFNDECLRAGEVDRDYIVEGIKELKKVVK